MDKSYAELGQELDVVDAQIAGIKAQQDKLPDLEEKRARLASEMNRKLDGLPEDPAESEYAVSQEENQGCEAQAVTFEKAGQPEDKIQTVDAEGLVPESVAKDLGLSEMREETDGSVRFGNFKIT